MPNGINRHFQRHHSDIYDLHTRQEIKRYADTLTLCQPSDMVVPTNMPSSILGLKMWNGWQCKECFKVGPIVSGVNQHCDKVHGWKSWQGEDLS